MRKWRGSASAPGERESDQTGPQIIKANSAHWLGQLISDEIETISVVAQLPRGTVRAQIPPDYGQDTSTQRRIAPHCRNGAERGDGTIARGFAGTARLVGQATASASSTGWSVPCGLSAWLQVQSGEGKVQARSFLYHQIDDARVVCQSPDGWAEHCAVSHGVSNLATHIGDQLNNSIPIPAAHMCDYPNHLEEMDHAYNSLITPSSIPRSSSWSICSASRRSSWSVRYGRMTTALSVDI